MFEGIRAGLDKLLGIGFERRMERHLKYVLEQNGWYVLRLVDTRFNLVAWKKQSPPMLVQCKPEEPGSQSERAQEELQFRNLANKLGCRAILAVKEEGGKWIGCFDTEKTKIIGVDDIDRD